MLVFLAFLTCLRLGWWQWERTQETTGTAQNFGYALLWPAFGVAFIYMWVRFLRLEVIKDAEDDEETDRAIAALLQDEGAAPASDIGPAEPPKDDAEQTSAEERTADPAATAASTDEVPTVDRSQTPATPEPVRDDLGRHGRRGRR